MTETNYLVERTKPRVRRLLEESGRVTPRMALEAYRGAGIAPSAWEFYDPDRRRGCPYGALMLWFGVPRSEADGWFDGTAIRDFAKSFNEPMTLDYSEGFWSGFDGDVLIRRISPPERRKGYRDGQRVRRFVAARLGLDA